MKKLLLVGILSITGMFNAKEIAKDYTVDTVNLIAKTEVEGEKNNYQIGDWGCYGEL